MVVETQPEPESETREMEAGTMRMSVDGTDVTVEWEDNHGDARQVLVALAQHQYGNPRPA